MFKNFLSNMFQLGLERYLPCVLCTILGAQDFVKAEAAARELLTLAPRLQEARIILASAPARTE